MDDEPYENVVISTYSDGIWSELVYWVLEFGNGILMMKYGPWNDINDAREFAHNQYGARRTLYPELYTDDHA